MATSNRRPSTVAGVLTEAAKFLDVADSFIETVSTSMGSPLEPGSSVQGDLRMLASWLEEHPDIDAHMYAVLDAVEAE